MEWFIWLISLFWIAFGSLAILYTASTRETTGNLVARLGRLPLGVSAVVFGLLLMIAARASVQSGFVMFLGILGLLKGGLFLWNPGGVYEKTVQWSRVEASDQTYRFMGIVSLILGTALFSWS